MKYVVFSNGTFAIIPELASHTDVVRDKNSVIGAGFCTFESYRDQYDDIRFKVSCYGKSDTLGIESHGVNDESLIKMGMR